MQTNTIKTDELSKVDEIEKSKIYVACLSSYNLGVLHGSWIEPKTDKDELEAQIAEVLKSSPDPDAEEYAIHDYDNFPNLGEYPDLDKVIEVVEAIKLHGVKAVEGFIGHFSIEDLEHFEDAFHGTYDSFKEFAQDYADDTIEGLADNNSTLANYFNYDSFERDLSFDYIECKADNYKVHIFNKSW